METKHKKLTSKAGLTIPKDIRLAAGFAGGMAVDIEKTADGIMIRKHRPTCCYCGSVDNVQQMGIYPYRPCPHSRRTAA